LAGAAAGLRVDDDMVGILNVERGEESSTGVEVCGVCVFGGVSWRCGAGRAGSWAWGGLCFLFQFSCDAR